MADHADERIQRLERDNAMLRRVVSLLHRVATLVQRSLELEATCYAILTGVTAGVGLGLNRAMLFLAEDGGRNVLRGVAAVGPNDAAEADRVWRAIEAESPDLDALYEAGLSHREHKASLDQAVRSLEVDVGGDTPIARALRSNAIVHGEGSDDLGGLLDPPTCVATPLHGRGRIVGVLYADNRFSGRVVSREAELVLALVADHAARAIEAARTYERMAEQARTDALTGLGHHGAMMARVVALVEQAHAKTDPLALAMIDLDDFKRVNDNLGHLVGDAMLVGVAERLREVLRRDAEAYRYGGEEFAVVLPGVPEAELATVAERLRAAVGDRSFNVDGGKALDMTCSVGIASLASNEGAGDLIARADDALLNAKRSGKNRFVLWAARQL